MGGYRIKIEPFLIACLTAMAVMAALIMWRDPPNMDDYDLYHVLACSYYPNSVWHRFREPCSGALNLMVFNRWEWPRSYTYGGATYSFVYYPLFLIWPDWKSAVLLGILLMIPGVLAASRLLKVKLSFTLLALCAPFPVMFYILRDYGALTLQFSLLYVLPWLAWKTVTARRWSSWLLFSLSMGFLLSVGIESKPIFIYFLPSVALVAMAACWSAQPGYSIVWLLVKKLWPGVLLSGVLMFALFTAYELHHVMYYRQLIGMVPEDHTFGSVLAHIPYPLETYWLNFLNAPGPEYGLRPMNIPHGPFDWRGFLMTLPFWLIFSAALLTYIKYHTAADGRHFHQDRMIAALLMASLMGVLLVGIDRHADSAHHILQPFYLLLGVLAITLQFLWKRYRKIFFLLAALLMVSQLVCTSYVVSQTPDKSWHEGSWERFTVLDFIRENHLAESGVIDHMDWGIYFISALYGPKNQVVLFQAPVPDAMRIAHKLGRDVVFIRRSWGIFHAPAGVRKVYPPPGMKGNLWEVWTNAPIALDVR